MIENWKFSLGLAWPFLALQLRFDNLLFFLLLIYQTDKTNWGTLQRGPHLMNQEGAVNWETEVFRRTII